MSLSYLTVVGVAVHPDVVFSPTGPEALATFGSEQQHHEYQLCVHVKRGAVSPSITSVGRSNSLQLGKNLGLLCSSLILMAGEGNPTAHINFYSISSYFTIFSMEKCWHDR